MMEDNQKAVRGLLQAESAEHRLMRSLRESEVAPPARKPRVVLFGSFHGGFHVLQTLLEMADAVEVVGVVSDDPSQSFCNAKVRLWRLPHTLEEELLVPRLAAANNLAVYSGRVKSPDFARLFCEFWKPDLCLMATFGQKIPPHIFGVPALGFYNFHHSDVTWPSYPGPDPIGDMVRDGKTHVVLTMHEVNELIDDGRAFARSHAVPLPPEADSVKVHRITWPQMGPFIREQVLRLVPRPAAQEATQATPQQPA
jgi:methionyl-tRNA formyltransferase